MRILYYLEPWIELQNPVFRFGALRNQVLGQAARLRKAGAEVTVLCGDGVSYEVARKGLAVPAEIDLRVIPHRELQSQFASQSQATRTWYEETYEPDQLERFSALLRKHLPSGYEPDALLTWESPIPFLRAMYPQALPVHMMPGFASKAPFPELVSLDCDGLFRQSTLATRAAAFREHVTTPGEQAFLKRVRAQLCDGFLRPRCPFRRAELDPAQRFSALVLLPLQVSGYYAFDDNCHFGSQFELLLHVLDRISPDVGVVVTQYVTKHTTEQVIRRGSEDYLRDRYPNFIYSREFDEIPGVSQYLLAEVDGVVTVSSSIGLQAALWNKPTFCLGNSHVNSVAQDVPVERIGSFLSAQRGDGGKFDGMLALLLTRMQPLARTRLYEGDWFSKFLARGIADYRQGKRDLDLFPAIASLDSYAEEWTSQARLAGASKDLRKTRAGARALSLKSHPELAYERVTSPQYEVVSFDVFDTLIQRPVERPSDVFKLMVPEARKIARGKLWNFSSARAAAEREARAQRLTREQDEVTLDDIYDELTRVCGLTREERDAVWALECETEARLLFARPFGVRCFEAARANGKKVVLVSDMYLPRSFIERVLTRFGIEGYEKLYLSHELGLRKNDGRLFAHLIKELSVPAARVLHVGDNPRGDVASAQLHELDTMQAPKAVDLMRRNKPWDRLYPHARDHRSLAEASVIGVWASEMFSDPTRTNYPDSHFDGSAFRLGYLGLGWIFLAFAKWLAEEAKRDAISDLYFLSRDGQIIKAAYDRIAPHIDGAPRSHYVLASRRVACVAQLRSFDDLASALDSSSGELALGEYLEHRFGLTSEQIDHDLVRKAGFEGTGEVIAPSKEKIRLSLLVAPLGDAILALAKAERDALLQHVGERGLLAAARPAVVDIGYAGSMQRSIAEIAGLPSLGGYYFMTFLAARELLREGHSVRAFAADFVDPYVSWHPFLQHRWCFEVMFSNCEGSVIRWDRGDAGALRAQKEPTEGDAAKHRFLRDAQAGAMRFIEDYLTRWSRDLSALSFESFGPQRAFLDFLNHPAACDAALLEGVPFDNAFAGVAPRFLVPPALEGESPQARLERALWKQGTEALLAAAPAEAEPSEGTSSNGASSGHAVANSGKVSKVKKSGAHGKVWEDTGALRRKLGKLKANPARFFGDSKSRLLRSLYALYEKGGR